MTDIAPYTSLKSICAMAMDEMGKSFAEFDRVWILGFRALIDLTYDFAGQPTTVRLMVSGNKTVPLPDNCLSWSKIGLLNDKGEIETLKINNALSTYRDNSINRIADESADVNGGGTGTLQYANFYFGGSCHQLFGAGNGIITSGECRVDEANRVIILAPDFAYPSIMLEFIDCPEKNDDYQIPTALQEAVIAFIKWKLKLGSMQEYYGMAVAARRRMPKKKFILQSFAQVVRESEGQHLRS